MHLVTLSHPTVLGPGRKYRPPALHGCHFVRLQLPRPFLLQGELTITSDMEELANALFYDSVPDSWTRHAYPSLLSLGAWYADLLLRIRVSRPLVEVNTRGKEGGYHRRPGIASSSAQWLTGLFFNIKLSSLKYLKRAPRRRADD